MHAGTGNPILRTPSTFLSDDHDRGTPAMRDRGTGSEEGNDDRPWVSWRDAGDGE